MGRMKKQSIDILKRGSIIEDEYFGPKDSWQQVPRHSAVDLEDESPGEISKRIRKLSDLLNDASEDKKEKFSDQKTHADSMEFLNLLHNDKRESKEEKLNEIENLICLIVDLYFDLQASMGSIKYTMTTNADKLQLNFTSYRRGAGRTDRVRALADFLGILHGAQNLSMKRLLKERDRIMKACEKAEG